jgi:hypothetical protein
MSVETFKRVVLMLIYSLSLLATILLLFSESPESAWLSIIVVIFTFCWVCTTREYIPEEEEEEDE